MRGMYLFLAVAFDENFPVLYTHICIFFHVRAEGNNSHKLREKLLDKKMERKSKETSEVGVRVRVRVRVNPNVPAAKRLSA